MKLIKIHRAIRFKQSVWMKEYKDLNTNLTAKATNNFELDFFKLMNGSVFGRTCENIRNRQKIQLVTDEKEIIKINS